MTFLAAKLSFVITNLDPFLQLTIVWRNTGEGSAKFFQIPLDSPDHVCQSRPIPLQ